MTAAAQTLKEWLRQCDLEKHFSVLRDNHIDLDVVGDLDADDLKELGFSLGDRKRFLAAAARRTAAAEADSHALQQTGAAPKEKAEASVQTERRLLTVIFCDVVGSTQLAEMLDPEDMREVIALCRNAAAGAVTTNGGTIAQFLGDGILAYFGYPQASEHDAERAIRAGLDVIASINALKPKNAPMVAARVGIATGVVVVGEQIGFGDSHERLAIGTTPNLAARLQDVAPPGEVVIARDTQRHVGRMFNYRPLGTLDLKGIEEPVEAFVVLGETTAISRFEARQKRQFARLIGREEEAETLLRRWRSAKAGDGQVVLLSGEGGIGKSRLIEGLMATLEPEKHTRLRFFGSPHHTRSALQPFIAQLESAAGFGRSDTPDVKIAKLLDLLGSHTQAPDTDVAVIAELLSIPAQGRFAPLAIDAHQKREMTLACLLAQAAQIAETTPAVMVFEDAHWMDPTSLDLLDRLAEHTIDAPILLVVTARPPFQPPWVGEPHLTTLTLNRLRRQDARRLISEVAGGKALPANVCEQINARADGIPLFIEEITNTLLDSGALRETSTAFELDGELPPLAIPSTLRATLVARLDRISDARAVAQMGAAIGREFSYEMLAVLSDDDEADLQRALDTLVESGLLTRRGAIPLAHYSFKHALVQDAAYSTMLHSRRRTLHGRIANALVSRFRDFAQAQPEVVAHHFTQGDMPAEAFHQWRRAGQLAFERSALKEAEALYRQSLDMLAMLKGDTKAQALAIDVRLEMRMVYAMLGDVRDALWILQEADLIAERLGDQGRHGVVNCILTNGHSLVGEVDVAIGFGARALKIAETNDDLGLKIITTTYLENTRFLRGEYIAVAELAEANLASLPQDWVDEYIGLPVPSPIYDRCWLVLALAYMGRFAEARQPAREAMDLAARSPRPIAKSVAHFANTTLRMVQGDWEGALDFAEGWVNIDRRSNIVLHLPWSVTSLAWVRAELGEDVSAIRAEGEALLKAHTERGVVGYICWAYTALSRAALAVGDGQAAKQLAERAAPSSPRHGGFLAYAEHLLGDLYARPEERAWERAVDHLERAVAMSRERGMAPLEAHSHMSLGKLYRQRGEPNRAASERAKAAALFERLGIADTRLAS
ncbi:MAG: adenylate/guanylate cyclase domain-containing protein [Pseudomonadota bacterium]